MAFFTLCTFQIRCLSDQVSKDAYAHKLSRRPALANVIFDFMLTGETLFDSQTDSANLCNIRQLQFLDKD